MAKETPDHHDADLVLRVYDMRREPVLRASRDAINGQFWPRNYDDVLAVTKPDNHLNAPWRQVGTYWEMVYNMVRHGVVHAEYFMESNAEGLLLFAKIHPYLEQIRRDASPRSFANAEWVAQNTALGRGVFELFRGRVQKALEARAAEGR